MDEAERIKKAYALRDAQGKRGLYSLLNPASLFMDQQREKDILGIFSKINLSDLKDSKILDVGCGNGGVLRKFLRYGAQPENCFGIDLLPGRISEAQKLSPNMDFKCQNAEVLPYEPGSFDIVLCFTVFSSILNNGMKANLAQEMLRVVKPGGFILWYDYHMNNPKNPDVRGMKKSEIHNLFAGQEIYLQRITLAPPLTRALAPYSWLACYLLERMVILNTHFLGLIRKAR